MNFTGKKVLITGGASGIGKIMARRVLEKGATVIIWDINRTGINETIAELAALGSIQGYEVDISDVDQVKATAAKILQQGGIDILINNAGIIVGKYFPEHSTEEILKTMNINATAPMVLALEFLPAMIARKLGHICNIASSGGLIANPKMSVYCASKWAVVGWSDSLRIEMQQQKTNIGITTVNPYYINTGMFDGVESTILPILNPEKVCAKIIKAIEQNRHMLSIPLSTHFIRLAQGVLPSKTFDWLVGDVLGVYHTMDHFVGRKK